MQVGGRLRWLRDTCGGQRRIRAFRVCVSAYVLTPTAVERRQKKSLVQYQAPLNC